MVWEKRPEGKQHINIDGCSKKGDFASTKHYFSILGHPCRTFCFFQWNPEKGGGLYSLVGFKIM